MPKPIRLVCSLFILALASACGPSAEEKALKQERVDLLAMQHEALTSGERECGGAQKRLDEFGAKNKDRLEKFNKTWGALDEKKRKQLVETEPFSSKEVNDELIAIMVSCTGIKRPVTQ